MEEQKKELVNKEEYQVAWAAGFFDGEGHLKTYKGRTAWIVVCQKDIEPLRMLRSIFGLGKIFRLDNRTPRGKKSIIHRWVVTGKQARIVLVRMLPYLVAKQLQVKTALNHDVKRETKYNYEMTEIVRLRKEDVSYTDIGLHLGNHSPSWVLARIKKLEAQGVEIPRVKARKEQKSRQLVE